MSISVKSHTSTDVSIVGTVVPRIGFGALHLAGPAGWGAPTDRAAAVRLVQSAVDSGIRYIDTADTLGPDVSEAVIAEALRPYRDDLVVATKAGMTRTGPHGWGILGHPAYLRQQAHASALRLGLDTIPLFYLHRVDPAVAFEDQVGALITLREEGVINGIGLSAVTLEQYRAAQALTPIAAVQNHYNVVSRASDDLLDAVTADGIPFISFWSLGHGRQLLDNPAVRTLATQQGVDAASLLIAWLVQRSPQLLPLAGTSNVEHLRSNLAALEIALEPAVVEGLNDLAATIGPIPDFGTR